MKSETVMADVEGRILLSLIIVLVGRSTAPSRLIAFPDLAQPVDHRLSFIH